MKIKNNESVTKRNRLEWKTEDCESVTKCNRLKLEVIGKEIL